MIYDHICNSCNKEFEAEYKMSDPVPDTCPNCNVKGQVKRLISSGLSGKVELSGKENVAKLWAEGKQLAKDAKSKEKVLANLVGEDRYENNMKSRR